MTDVRPSPTARPWRPDGLRRLASVAPVRYVLTLALAFGTAFLATHAPWPPDSLPYRLLYLSVAATGLAMVVSGAWQDRARLRLLGVLVVGAVSLQFIGDVGSAMRIVSGNDRTWPYWTDPIFLLSYLALMVAVMLVVQRREGRRDSAALLDAGIITVGCGVLSYAFLISDTMVERGVSVLGRAVGVSYLVCDVFVVGVVVRLLLTQPGRRSAPMLMAAALLSLLFGDILFAGTTLGANPDGPTRWVDGAYLAFYPLFGAAMRFRGAGELVSADVGRVNRLGRARLTALAAGAMLAPLSLLVEDLTGRTLHVVEVSIGGMVVFLLVVLRMSGLVRAVETKSALLEVLSRTDALTTLPNRRTFDHELDRSMTAAGSDFMLAGLSVAMLDLDRFKAFNDVHGHGAGDELLVGAARAWSDELVLLAPAATLARYGGEEFAVVLPGADADAAVAVIERLLGLTPAGQSFSAGVAQWDGSEAANALLARADLRLYEAKAAGRCQVFGGSRVERESTCRGRGPQPTAAEAPAAGSRSGSWAAVRSRTAA